MPVFTFSGKDASGQKITGERVAPNKQTLQQALRRERMKVLREKLAADAAALKAAL